MIQCQNLKFSFDGTSLISVSEFQIKQGQKIWLYGASGSGKSTFLSLLAGILRTDQGLIVIDGFNLTEAGGLQVDRFRYEQICYIHQENHFIDHWTARQNLKVLTSASTSKIETVFQKIFLKESHLDQLVSSFSGGQRQLLSLVKAVLLDKKILFFDEPTAHLDEESFARFLALFENEFKECTTIMVSHDPRFDKSLFTKRLFKEVNL